MDVHCKFKWVAADDVRVRTMLCQECGEDGVMMCVCVYTCEMML